MGYRAYADWTRIFLAEFYIALLQGEKKPSLRVVLKNLLFLATAKRAAAKRAEALLRRAMENRSSASTAPFARASTSTLAFSSMRWDGRSLPWPISGMAVTLR